MQDMSVAAHDVHQLEEALTLPPAPGPAAPIRASPSDDSPAVPEQAVHVAEATTLAADEQPMDMQALQQEAASPAGSAEAPASGQPEGSLALQQAPAPEATAQDTQEVPASEAVSSGAACSKRVEVEDSPAPPMGSMTPDKQPKSSQAGSPTTSTASDEPATLLDEEEESRGEVPRVSSQLEAVPSSPVESCNNPQGVKEAARSAVPAASIHTEAVTSSPMKDPSSPHSFIEGDSPISPMSPAGAPTARSANTPAGGMATITDKAAAEAITGVPSAIEPASQLISLAATAVSIITAGAELPIPEAVAAGTDKAADKATTDVPPAIDSAIQPVTPATPESTPPQLIDAAPAPSVPLVVADASLDFKEEEVGHAAGAVQGKGSETRPSATITEAKSRATAEGKAAPDSPSALSEAEAQPSTYAEGFTDIGAAADSHKADVRAKAVPVAPMTKARAAPNSPAEESSAADTIAAKHAVGSASTMPKNLASSSSAQAKSERQAAKSNAAAQAKSERKAAKSNAAAQAKSERKAAKSKAAAQAKSERKAAKSNAAAQTASSAAVAAASPPLGPAESDSESAPVATATAGYANVAAVSKPAPADAAAAGSSVFSSKADGNVVALRHTGNRLDPVHAPGSAVSRTDHADATAIKSAAALLADDPAAAKPAAALPAADSAAANSAIDLPGADPVAAKPAAALPAADPAAAKPAVSKATATEATSSVASGGHAAAAAFRPVQPGSEAEAVSGSSVGSSEGEYEVVAGADYLEQLKDPKKRRLSSGFTAVVNM